ncbi:hypothetical protein TWF481_010169 [Arthrobotrys musiformis]|uniref:WSC domain-containing protein n=1 Tax=Arthrobotrys musiformis TaxID=47236 RepID=A0AAV9W022_9PEZI
MQLKSLLWAFAATSVFASAVVEDVEKRYDYYGAPNTVTKWATKWATKWSTKYVTRTTTCTKWSKTRTITKTKTSTKWSKTTTKWSTKTTTKTVTKPTTKTVTNTKTATKTATSTKTDTKTTTATSISTSISTSVSTSVSTTTETSTVTETPTVSPGARYIGCYKENEFNGAVLQNSTVTRSNMTPDLCSEHCLEEGYVFAGVKNGTICACSNELVPWAEMLEEGHDDCDMDCGGDDTVSCGGAEAWEITVEAATVKPAGCYDDNNSNPVFGLTYFYNEQMTQGICQDLCFKKLGNATTLAGIKGGRECYCADSFLNGPVQYALGRCDTPCADSAPGAETFCGGTGFISLFAYTT